MEEKMNKLIFYKCQICGNITIKFMDKGVTLFCCGQKMNEVAVGQSDGAVKKHKPVVYLEGAKVDVKVGEVAHPMTEEHYISHVILETTNGFQVVQLATENTPEAQFCLPKNEKPVSVYSICNLHGIFVTDIF